MSTLVKRIFLVAALVIVVAVAVIFWVRNQKVNTVTETKPALVTVRFGMLPYGDHTYAVIGAKQGWFEQVGINLEYRPIKIEDAVPFLSNGSLDSVSCPPGVIMAAVESNPGVVSYVFGDIFQGYAIMAQPGNGFKSVGDFMQSGMARNDAIKAAVIQIRGKTFAYPAEAAIKPFIDLALAKGALTRNNFKSLVLDDPLTVNAMRNHQADFEVGGVPSRIILEREGYKPIITSNDLANAAKPSPDSAELSSIFTDGWACTRKYYEQQKDTILRMASVNFRITKFINDHPDQALAIHMPYLSQVTGQPFTNAEGKIIYGSLDPFFTFEAQKDWYHNPDNTYYFKNLDGAIINSYIRQGIYKTRQPAVADVIVADQVYLDLERLKGETDSLLAQVSSDSHSNPEVEKYVDKAKSFYDAYDYLDSQKQATAALEAKQKR